MIPITRLSGQYATLKNEIDAALQQVLASGQFVLGPNVEALESELAGYLGCRHAVGVNSGTDALVLALRALDIGPGDEVITTPFTFFATGEAIAIVGASPVLADIEPESYNIAPASVAAAIGSRTRAILAVHLYGNPAEMRELVALARAHGLAIIEDCAQSIGAEIEGRRTGSFGDVACFSFFPSKNLGACGDGGLVTTPHDDVARRVRALRAHGSEVKYHNDEVGYNSRLDEIQAAILRVKLPHLEGWIEARRRLAARYCAGLADAGVALPVERPSTRCVYHQFTIRADNRDELRQSLRGAGVDSVVYYPVPLHLQKAFCDGRFERGMFPAAELAADQVLSLPMFPELSHAEQDAVVDAVRTWSASAVPA